MPDSFNFDFVIRGYTNNGDEKFGKTSTLKNVEKEKKKMNPGVIKSPKK